MAVSKAQFDLIEQTATLTTQSCCRRFGLQFAPPLPVELVAADLGLICVIDENEEHRVGALDAATGRIRLAPIANPITRAFAVAHEIGHWVLHERQGEYKLRGGAHPGALLASAEARMPEARQQLQEAEANLFAAALVAPLDLLLNEALRFTYIDIAAVSQLADQFHTSYMTMAFRLHDLYRHDAWRGPSIDPQVFKGFAFFKRPNYEPVTMNEYHRRFSGTARESVEPPFVIEFAGTPNSGKDTTMRILADYFYDIAKCRVRFIDEARQTVLTGKGLDVHLAFRTVALTVARLYEARLENPGDFDVILVNRGIFDRIAFIDMLGRTGRIDAEQAQIHTQYLLCYTQLVDIVVMLLASPETSQAREWEERRRMVLSLRGVEQSGESQTLNSEETVRGLNASYSYAESAYGSRFGDFHTIVTDDLPREEAARRVKDLIRERLMQRNERIRGRAARRGQLSLFGS